MIRRVAFVVVLPLTANIVLGAEGAAARPASEGARYRARQFDVSAVLERDRSLHVDETVVFDLHDGTFTSVWRDIPARRTDGIEDVTASMDGVSLPPGREPGQVEIRNGSDARATWHFVPTRGPHTFTLSYRLKGVATVAPDGSDELAWIALPDKHGYAIEHATVTLQLPARAAVMGRPRVSPFETATTIDASGRLTVVAANVRRDGTVRVDLQLARGALTETPPAWQARAAERSRRGPWLVLVAGIVLMAGLAWLAVFRSAWPGQRSHRTMATVTSPPDPQRRPAVAARLAGYTGRLTLVTTTLVELASRGVLRVEDRPRPARILGRGFTVRLDRVPSGLATYEAAVIDLAFGAHAARGGEISWRRLAQLVAKRGRRLDAAMQETLRSAGLIDRDREAARRTLQRAALVVFILTLGSVGAAVSLASLFGPWVIALPAALLLVTIVFAAAAGSFTMWTPAAGKEAERWRAFFNHVAQSAKHTSPAMPAEWLPWAVLAGVGAAFAKRSGSGTLPPAWFSAATDADRGAAFEAFLASHAAFGGDGGAGASAGGGGGAAGGGGSGAG